MSEIDRLKEFARWVIQETCFEGGEIDNENIEFQAKELGLIVEEPYDPERHPNIEADEYDLKPGDMINVFAPLLKSA